MSHLRYILILLLLFPLAGEAQWSAKAKKILPDFTQNLNMADSCKVCRDSAISIGLRILGFEIEKKEKGFDTLFFAKLTSDIAGLLKKSGNYMLAARYYYISASAYEKKGQYAESGAVLSYYHYCFNYYQQLKEIDPSFTTDDSAFFAHGNEDSTIWFSSEVKEIKPTATSDTVWVILKCGKAQGLVKNTKLDVFTTFDTFQAIQRPIVLAGSGRITEIGDFESKGYVVIDSGFTDILYLEDAWEIKVKADKTWLNSVFAKLAAYNIRLYNYTFEQYYVASDAALTYNTQRFDKAMKTFLLQDLRSAAEYYDKTNPGILDVVISSGRFKGYTYDSCMRYSSLVDVEQFLDFVSSYPGKYINREFNCASTYVAWVINDCVLGNNESAIIDSVFAIDSARLIAEYNLWGPYFRQVVKHDSLMLAKIQVNFELDQVQQEKHLKKLQILSRLNQMNSSDSFYTMQLMYNALNQSKYSVGLSYGEYQWNRVKGFDKQLVALYMGIFYSNLNRNEEAVRYLDSSLEIDSTYYYARGYKGWNLLKMGNIKQAFPYCEFSWLVDSTVNWTNVNLAHAYLLKGNTDEANRLYRNSFKYMQTESDFYQGLLADFNYFIEKGLNEDEFRKLKEQYSTYYLSNWKSKIIADSLKARGNVYMVREQYADAVLPFKAAVELHATSANPDAEELHYLNQRIGYAYYKAKNHKTALTYYRKCVDITGEYSLGEDNLVSDLTNVANIYDWLNDTLKQAEYFSRAGALEVSLRERREPKRLFSIVIGPSIRGNNDSFAHSDARNISNLISSGAAAVFDEVRDILLTGENATVAALQMILDTAIYTLKENDVFIFSYSGDAKNGVDEGIFLSDGLFPLRDLMGYLGQVPAGRQIHLADCNGLDWRGWYQRGNFSSLSNEKRSLMFLGLKTVRIENASTRKSVLAEALIDAYKSDIYDGEITAASWLSGAVSKLYHSNQLYAVEFQTFGHDFVLGSAKVSGTGIDTIAPIIELFGATELRGENISMVSSKGVSAGRITDDSKIVYAEANGMELSVSKAGRFELPTELNAAKNIIITAVDEAGNRSRKEFLVTRSDQSNTNESNRYAWIFVSDDYSPWNPLANPVFDGESISELLRLNFGYQVNLIKNPSKRVITEKLDFIRRQKYGPTDQVFVFFAGHGLYDSVWGGYYVCPESQLPGSDPYYETYYPQQKIADLLEGCQASNVFLVMDVCFGGKMFDKHDKHEYKSIDDGRQLSTEDFIKRQLRIPVRQFLTSGGNNYVEDGVPGSHSPFAARFIAALEQSATEKEYISASEIMDYMRLMRTIGNDKKSLPRYGFFGGDKDGEYLFKVTRKISNKARIAGF